ncbi:MAG: hypothetical protein Udaeo2_17870 [Candidatus Udaeobacter sp.]|nr:MAG: hypothetical protein Udaeo2_17870 [Candidatus Udaeobacter sp.]
MNACLRTDHVAHLIVFEANDCVGNLIEPAQGFARLGVASSAFEPKRQGCEHKHQCSGLASQMRDIRRRARTRAPSEPCADENHSCTSQRLANLLRRFEGGLIANLGVATRAQAAGDGAAELNFVWSNGARQRLHVGVDG